MAVVLVTGSARGLGLALIAELINDPTVGIIIATSRGNQPSAALQDLITSSHKPAFYVSLDVTSTASITSAVGTITQILLFNHGKSHIDILVNNAGIQMFEAGRTPAMNALEMTLAANVVGVHKITAALLPLLRNSPEIKKIADITSTLGSIALRDVFARSPSPSYKISKAALNMLTVQYAMDLDHEGFCVFGVSYGWLRTDLGGKVADLEPQVGANAT